MTTPHPFPPLLQIHDATVVKGRGVRVLDGISLTVQEGEHTAILGPNGSGKTSLIRLIAFLHYPLLHGDGSPPVRVFGRERWNVFALRQRLGIVSPELDDTFTDARHGRLRGLEAAVTGFFAAYGLFQHQDITPAMWEQARAALDLMEASHLAKKPLGEMSTGEARRVLIARALAPDPAALLLDEPTTGLDMLAARRFLETLRGVARQGKTILLVTHHVEEVIPEVERVVMLRGGRVFRDGPKIDVLTSANLATLYAAPLAVAALPDGYYAARHG